MMESPSYIPASSPAKRQKTGPGPTASAYFAKPTSTANNTYDSDADSGDELFDGFIPDTPAKYETQATQIVGHAPSAIQVPASSPLRDEPPRERKRPISSLMAPAGTAFKAPAGIQRPVPKTVINLDDEDDAGPIFGGEISDDDGVDLADIPKTTFRNTAQRSQASASAAFQSIVASSVYRPGEKTQPRKQTQPERAMPVVPPIRDILIADQPAALRSTLRRLRSVFPSHTIRVINEKLLSVDGNYNKAVEAISMVDNVLDDNDPDEIQEISRPANIPQMKRGLTGQVLSVKDKYSSTLARPVQKATPVVATTPPKPKRRLQQGRKHASSPAPPLPPSPQKMPSSPAMSLREYDTDDSGFEGQEAAPDDTQAQLLSFLNTCKEEDIVELTNSTKANAKIMIEARPFKNLDEAREVSNTKALKSGKKSTKAPLGDRIVETALQMFVGYEAVDALVTTCEDLAKPLNEEMGKWGFNAFGAAKNGELELVSFEDESQRDSGIGSPISNSASANGDEEVQTIKKRTVNFLKKPNLMAEDCVLKDYQIVGLNWLNMMYKNKLSCILADDMGLGKTCQVISFLAHLVETGRPGPHLVFGPAAVFENWCQEFRKFAPNVTIEPYHGSAAQRVETAEMILENRENINVIITTYDMATKPADNKFLRRLQADVVVCDEGHVLKNAATQKNQALDRISNKANFRLLLTGTPLQNNLVELVTLLAFILPSVFEERKEDLNFIFKAKATTRDTDHGALLSAQRIARARSMLTPFVLRRKKHQVLKHLPTKTCRVERCDLLSAQKKIYDEFADAARERARARLDGLKIAAQKTDEQNPIMQLRKAAIHPLLFRRHFTNEKIEKMADLLRRHHPSQYPSTGNNGKREHLIGEMRLSSDFYLHGWCQDYPCIAKYDLKNLAWMDSGKVSALLNLVKDYRANGDRVLIFSQFSLVLDILETVLSTELVTYTRIDGSTKIDERQPLIERFRDDPDITAFLLTTKAGGTGINLMYANKVIIFDGSFNPQDDVQAENRAHRVGQTRDVEVVRLVTRGTIEEAIWKMGNSKLMLDGRVAGEENEEAGEKAISKMLLDGVTITDEEAQAVTENGAPAAKSTSLKRKSSSFLDLATSQKDVDEDEDGDGEAMLV